MKIDTRSADRFCENPQSDIAGILIYGDNQGLAEERAARLHTALLGPDPDPIQITDVTVAKMKEIPSVLADEVRSRSLLGDRRVVRLRDNNAQIAKALPEVLASAEPGDAVIIMTSGNLAPRDKVRKLFEDHPRAAAIPCYADDNASMERFVGQFLNDRGVLVDGSVRGYLAGQLGSDRQVARRELEKLALYSVDLGRDVTIEDVAQIIDEGESLQLNDVSFAVFGGDQLRLEQSLNRLFQAVTNPIVILMAVTRHAQRLHLLDAGQHNGLSVEQAAKALRPPLFFKDKQAFLGQGQRWRGKRIVQALEILRDAEIDCKTTGYPAEAVTRRALMRIAAAARGRS